MPVETKDIVGWAVTGGIGVLGLVLNLLTRRDAKRKARREAEAIWSLHPSFGAAQDAAGKMFRLSLSDPASNRYRLSDMKVVEPKGAKLARPSRKGRDVNDGQTPAEFSDRLVFDQDLDAGIRIDHQSMSLSRSNVSGVAFFADWPSATKRKKRSRLVVVINVEEISSSRRESRLTIRSQPIDWTVSIPPNAT